ncbi:MAG: Hint domain-containing protein [Planctomycetota bacterium]
MANGESITGAVTGVVVSATVGVVAGKALGKARGRGNSDADGEAPRDASDKPAPPPTTSPEPAKVDKVAPSDPPSANVDAGDAGGGPMCFPAGTLVATPVGDVPIEEIAAGCVVYGYDVETGQVVEREVVQVFRNSTRLWVEIVLDGETLVAPPAHLMWVESQRDWIAAKSLEVGMELRLLSGEFRAVREVRVRVLEAPEATYNFEVREVHDYFVGHLAVLVHNECVEAPKKAVIGENMEGVERRAEQTGAETFQGRMMQENKNWIEARKAEGYEIEDIGPDFSRRLERTANQRNGVSDRDPSSPYYEMERTSTKDYPGYKKNFKREGELQGGSKEVDGYEADATPGG